MTKPIFIEVTIIDDDGDDGESSSINIAHIHIFLACRKIKGKTRVVFAHGGSVIVDMDYLSFAKKVEEALNGHTFH